MGQKAIKYIPIDSKIIEEGLSYEFTLYTPTDASKSKMECFKESGVSITSAEKIIINSEKLLYVLESEHAKYEYLRTTLLNTVTQEEIQPVSFEDHSSKIYENASNVLHDLFQNPETLGNYEASKEVVNDMVGVILNDNFTVTSLMSIAAHDYYTHTHSINVAIYALSLGSFLKLTPKELEELGESALLHDLGKSKVDPAIINKNGKLTDEEFEQMKKHPAMGYTIALKLGIKKRNVLEGIRCHHEKMDGTGYPFGRKREGIPYFARIVGLCDVFDALTSKRSYKEAMTTFEALALIRTKMNKHVDLELLKKMIEMFR